MKNALTTLLLLTMANVAHADSIPNLPSFDVICPGNIAVHADQEGPVTINDKDAVTKAINERSFEAKGSGVTISIVLADDDSVTVSSTGKAPNGICQSLDD
ncbi:hypothetical protein [Pseudomonas mandelii]|uniref:Uncharacterized protein n=1 Tax=Pseudomonas mandelii TaxID=75612 RepID=A0ABY0W1Z3_9PSED|nr:hypothetical protein [Pseudomonas mandelii]TWS03443.1 hypothetical protein FJD35_31305 [Pseudomonas mandelii]SDU69258.1 hypothetical protein SAMN04489801_6074 [Pseudomonas mandelii]